MTTEPYMIHRLASLSSKEKRRYDVAQVDLHEFIILITKKSSKANFSFYIKSTSYVGKVTLNFGTSPEKVGTDNHDQYFLIDNPYSFLVNRKETLYLLFPLKILFSMESVSISQVNMPPIENVVQQIPFKDISDIKCDEFIKLYYYFTVNPCGIAEWSIIYTSSNQLLFMDEKIKSYRFEIFEGKKYSLTNAFKLNRIPELPKEIFLGMCYSSTGASFNFHVLSCSDGGSNISSFKVNQKNDTNRPVYFKYLYNENVKSNQIPVNTQNISFSKDFASQLTNEAITPELDNSID